MKSLLQFILSFKKKSGSAAVAKERLQIIVSHERAERNKTVDFLPKLQQELVAVIAKYVKIDPSQVKVDLGETDNCSVLELNITLPNLATAEIVAA